MPWPTGHHRNKKKIQHRVLQECSEKVAADIEIRMVVGPSWAKGFSDWRNKK